MLDIKADDYVMDPACGSGGFLLHALDHVRKLASQYYDEDSPEHFNYWHSFAEKRLSASKSTKRSPAWPR